MQILEILAAEIELLLFTLLPPTNTKPPSYEPICTDSLIAGHDTAICDSYCTNIP